tara:strand:+ start:1294 stop:2190 length:897 start_codon:yes stop_codon:yes gene_type:complete
VEKRASILIVSRNRREHLRKTIDILYRNLNMETDEIRVFLDGCTDNSESLKKIFPYVYWYGSDTMIGASGARNILYKTAKGALLFGFDDDAHPLQRNFIEITQKLFDSNSNVGLIAFKEIRGVFESDNLIPKKFLAEEPDILVNDFVGCGFVVKKKVYERTRGFPEWIDIYGEEVCVAIEILDKGKDILYTHQVQVNHRVDRIMRNKTGAGYFRFGKQLKNTAWFYFVYYPFPLVLKKIGKLYLHNLKKYGIKDSRFFAEYCKAFMTNLFYFGMIMKYRLPVKKRTLKKFNQLPKPQY